MPSASSTQEPGTPSSQSGEQALRTAILGLFVLGCLYTLYFARHFLIPLVFALLISLLLFPFVRLMKRRLRLPTPLGAGVLLLAGLGFLMASVFWVAEPAHDWLQTVPLRLPEVAYRLKSLKKPIQKVAEASAEVEKLTDMTASPKEPKQVVAASSPSQLQSLLTRAPVFLASLLTVLILVYFILASGDSFLRNLVGLLPHYRDKKKAVNIARTIEGQISSYLQTITAINLCLGLAIGTTAYFVGLKNYILWGVMACVLNYIPYLGAFAGMIVMLLVSLLSFVPLSQVLLMPSLYLAITTVEGNLITPSILGRFMTLNPLAVFLSLLFWGWLWGISGVFLAVPLLAIFKILCDHIEPLHPIGAFLTE